MNNAKHIAREVQEFLTASNIKNVVSGMRILCPASAHIFSVLIATYANGAEAAGASRAAFSYLEGRVASMYAYMLLDLGASLLTYERPMTLEQVTSLMAIAHASSAPGQSPSSQPTRHTAKVATRASGARTIAA